MSVHVLKPTLMDVHFILYNHLIGADNSKRHKFDTLESVCYSLALLERTPLLSKCTVYSTDTLEAFFPSKVPVLDH